jgi:hypothetical protein
MLNKDEVPFRDNVQDQVELIGNRIKIAKLEDQVRGLHQIIQEKNTTIASLEDYISLFEEG